MTASSPLDSSADTNGGTAGEVARAPAPRTGTGQQDLISGPIGKTLLLFTLPTLASNIAQSLNGSINSIWVGRFLGEAALAATANANVIIFLTFASVFGFGMAATVMIGQASGRKDIDGARRAYGAAIGFCGAIGIVVGIIGWFSTDHILRALGTPGDAFSLARDYLRVTFIVIPLAVTQVVMMMGLRGAGDSVTPMRFMILSVVIDISFNPLLILGLGPFPRLGITGSALASVAAGLISQSSMIAYVYWKDLPLRLRGRELAYLIPHRDTLGYLVTKGLPMGAQMFVISGAGLIMARMVNDEGLLTSAAYGASLQLWTYLQMPALAVSAGVSAMAAQAIGAKLDGRINPIVRAGIGANFLLTGILIGVLLLFDRPALSLFLGDGSPAVEIARRIQLIASWSYLLFGVTMVLFGVMRAYGAVMIPLVTLAVALYPARLGALHLLYPLMGADAIWLSFPIGSLVSLVMALAFWRWGNWRSDGVIKKDADQTAAA